MGRFRSRNTTWASVLGCLALVGCVSVASTVNSNAPVEDALSSARPVNLDQVPADTVRSIDVIRRSKDHVKRTGEIYIMRGLANVFSRGIDDMARQLRSQGYDAANFSYTEWQLIAEDIVQRNRSKDISHPVIIIGHSLGGNESSKFANYLARNGVNIPLVVTFDPVETGHVGSGIGKVVNYYLPKPANNRIVGDPGFNGSIDNVDVTVDPSITHTNVDKNPEFQATTFASIENLTKKLRKRSVRRKRSER